MKTEYQYTETIHCVKTVTKQKAMSDEVVIGSSHSRRFDHYSQPSTKKTKLITKAITFLSIIKVWLFNFTEN